MEDYVEYMFKVPLVHISVRQWDVKKKSILNVLDDMNLKVLDNENVLTNYSEKGDYENNNQFFQNVFAEEMNFFGNYININEYEIYASWFEVANYQHHHVVHNHGATGYSAVCYVEYDKNVHTPTQFIAPFNNFINGTHLNYSPNVDEGSLIFFPSSILHYTNQNKSKKKRTILSFNIRIK